ncbi:biotin carboxylase N-terminal domain-containing protein, partial [uncultured Marinobacter sp.]|uniref:ATP-binding protein n=1 Tax=uncultured Marinobacter sp. TaxID=187379 RepID=UPI002597ECA4
MLKKLLIANRGEIAVRVIRTAKALGYRTVAVYSEADANALHVEQADEAVCIGPAASAQSYLNIPALISAAEVTDSSAIHPGYGFLSENGDFAAAVEEAGLIFIGPCAETIRQMGDKAAAKTLMQAADVPVIPGQDGIVEDNFATVAEKIGFPLLVKAAAGGGGKGMRVVEDADGLEAAVEAARHEAEAAFGDGRLLLERYITRPRHIEVQILADNKGHTVHLGERECSVQRRHQKVIEEAPSPAITPELREQMGAVA